MHAFVQEAQKGRVVDRAWRVEQPQPSTGHVLEAPYFGGEPLAATSGWWSALVRALTRASKRMRATKFNLPFDDQGNDVLELCAGDVAGVTITRGEIVRLRSGNNLVLRDLWFDDVRLVEMDDFAVVGDDGVVIVACGMAPLVVTVPSPCEMADWLASSSSRLRELAPPAADRVGASLRLEAGDSVEVRGIARALSSTARTIDLSSWHADYRTAPPIPDRLIGDEEGMRLVIRRLG
jgi:hypothetical protein